MNLANKLTIFRLILVVVMLIVPFLGISGAVGGISVTSIILVSIFVIASITDKLDGYIARSRNQITTFGKFLDPIADKIMVIVAMILLVEMGTIPAWIPSIIVIREFIVSGYRLIAVEKNGTVISANFWGKIKTVTQIIAVILAFLDTYTFATCLTGELTGLSFFWNLVTMIFMISCVIATIFSGWEYLKGSRDLLRD